MKQQTQGPTPASGKIQWPQFPAEVFYKLPPEGAQALQQWHYDLTFAIQRQLDAVAAQITDLKNPKTA
jgi:hypothetical protein